MLSGQSNMQGIGLLKNLGEDWQQPIPEAQFWNGKAFETLDPGKTKLSSRAGEFGPELAFAKAMAAAHPGKTFYLIKFHRSGQPLYHGWDGNKWAGGDPQPGRANFYPGETKDDPAKGKHYLDMMKVYGSALDALRKEGKTPAIRGFLWMQGEQDAKHEDSAATYAASLRRLKARIEEDLGAEAMPVAFGQVLPHEPAMERFTQRAEIRAQMAAADARSGKPESIPGVTMVSTDGFPLKPDTVHYDAKGQVMLGEAFAKALLGAAISR
ncbi:MAG: sialate O-acetylesterase [Verrucomicrobiales bacterium]